jgi:hypothetical protein
LAAEGVAGVAAAELVLASAAVVAVVAVVAELVLAWVPPSTDKPGCRTGLRR